MKLKCKTCPLKDYCLAESEIECPLLRELAKYDLLIKIPKELQKLLEET